MAKRSKTPAAPWGVRIVGHDVRPASEFLANELNFRTHPGPQRDALRSVLTEVGFVQAVIVNKRSDASWGTRRGVETLIDGHARVEEALSRGDETPVPVVFVDLSRDEERVIAATLDPIGAMAGRDDAKLAELIDGLDTSVDLDAILNNDRKATRVEFEASARKLAVVVECPTEAMRDELLEQLRKDGWVCRPTTK